MTAVMIHVAAQKGMVSTGRPAAASVGDAIIWITTVSITAAVTVMALRSHPALASLKVWPTAMAVSAGENPHSPCDISSHGQPQQYPAAIPAADPASANSAALRLAAHSPARKMHPAIHESIRKICDNPLSAPWPIATADAATVGAIAGSAGPMPAVCAVSSTAHVARMKGSVSEEHPVLLNARSRTLLSGNVSSAAAASNAHVAAMG